MKIKVSFPQVQLKKVIAKRYISHRISSNTIIFIDSIAKGIHIHEFNRFIKNSTATMFNFLGASSHQMLHYLDVHLEDRQINTVVIHVGINDILRGSSQSSIDGLLQNIKICL